MDLKLSEIQIVPIKPRDGLVGFASFVINDSWYVSSVAIYTRRDGNYRVTYPTRNQSGLIYPIRKDVGE